MRGEFHFWGWNSILRLNPSLFQVSYSLCDAQKVSAWKNATNGMPVDLSNARIKVFARAYVPVHDSELAYAVFRLLCWRQRTEGKHASTPL
jgi:hypothetical protein